MAAAALSNRALCAALDGLAFRTDHPRFALVHRSILLFYRGAVIPFVQSVLRVATSDATLHAFPRQSAASGAAFNLFASDLDLGIETAQNASERDFRVLRAALKRGKSLLPFLGEVEIYLHGEWARRRELEVTREGWFSSLRDLRKLTWMEMAFQEAQTNYHRRKSLRSIKRIFVRLGCAEREPASRGNLIHLSKEVETLIRDLVGASILDEIETMVANASIDFWCPYLAVRIRRRPEASTGTEPRPLVLTPSVAVALLAILPSLAWPSRPEYFELVETIRMRFPQVRRHFAEVLEWERLQFASYVRSLDSVEPWIEYCLKSLNRDIAENPLDQKR